jgi:bifunctional lysine-specific demethylase and histidyl-hydroxylase MINA
MPKRRNPAFDAACERIEALLAPFSLADLLESHWGHRPFIRLGEGAGCFPGLPTESDFDYLLASLTAPKAGWFSLVKIRGRAPEDCLLTADGWLNLPEVYRVYREGYSLLLNQVQKRHQATGWLCRMLEAALTAHEVLLSRHIGANLYLSPPRSQGFSIHYDPHDVLVLQLEGVKQWTLYEQRVPFPLNPPEAPFSPDEAGAVDRTFVISPGDLIYIPRGVLHEARTLDTSSLHLTLSVDQVTWRDLLTEVLGNDPLFREALPIGFGRGGQLKEADRESIYSKLCGFAEKNSIDRAVTTVCSMLFGNLDRLPGTGPVELVRRAEIDAETRLRLADGIFGEVCETQDCAILHLPGASFSASRYMAEVFRHLLRAQSFSALELPVSAPVEEKLAFLRDLAVDGFLITAGPTDLSVPHAEATRVG